MLRGISPSIGPDLLAILSRIGHGDEIVLADAHFPGESCKDRILRANGILITQLLSGILKLFPLETYAESTLIIMAPVEGTPSTLSSKSLIKG